MRLLLDTGAWLLALAGEEPFRSLVDEADEAIVPGLVLAEVDYHLRRDRAGMHKVVDDLARGAYVLETPTVEDLERARDVDRKFKSLSLGLVDASIVALAERTGVHRVLTIDSDFAVVRFGPHWRGSLTLPHQPRGRSR